MLQHASVLPSLLMAENCSFVWLYHIQFIHLPVDGHLGCFHFSIMEMLKRTFMYKFLCRHVFISLGYIMNSKIAESYGNSMLNFLRNCQSVFQSNCIVLNSQQQRMRVPATSSLTLVIVCLFSIAIPVGVK